MKIIVYTQLNCIHCRQHLAWMQRKDIPFEERDITSSKEYFKEFKEFKPPGTPCTVISGKDEIRKYFGHTTITKNRIIKKIEENNQSSLNN